MIVYPLSCPAEILRGQLKHSWLENQVRDISADDIVSFWKDGEWSDKIEEIFPYSIQQTVKLADDLAEGFSPSQLVDQLAPLKELAADQKSQLKRALHEAYLEVSNITSFEEPIRSCSRALEPELDKLQALWKEAQTPDNEIALRESWENFRSKGLALHKQLEKLPKGVIVP